MQNQARPNLDGTRVILMTSLVAATLLGCMADAGLGLGVESLREPGPWSLPATVRNIGERQYVRYDSAPLWDGGSHCSGGLLEGTRELGDYLMEHFPQIRLAGGYSCRQNTGDLSRTSVHGTGRALDLMLATISGDADNGAGDPIANWLVTHAELIGVQYIIWDHWDWQAELSGRKDTPYGGPIPHVDHIHMELSEEAAHRRSAWFSDRDEDGVRNERDNCPMEPNREQEDGDGDRVGNRCDNCPRDDNEHQLDSDRDGVGDRCDNCRRDDNAGQEDTDADGVGNRCDNCDGVENPHQLDTDDDGRGDACDPDDDGDGVPDTTDNCRLVANPAQGDRDADGVGDRCSDDADGDGVLDATDNCARAANPAQADRDHDGEGDACDDRDGDGVLDRVDVCPDAADRSQSDLDADGIGDACDDDRDGDGRGGGSDLCPDTSDAGAGDLDLDGIGDACDPDADGDAVLDDVDVCVGVSDAAQADADADGIGDACDPEPTVSDMADPGPAHTEDDAMSVDPGTVPGVAPGTTPGDAPGTTPSVEAGLDSPARGGALGGCAVSAGRGSCATWLVALGLVTGVLSRRRRR